MMNKKVEPAISVLAITLALLLVYLFSRQDWALFTALSVGIMGILSSWLRLKIHWLWMKIAWLMSLTFSKIMLTLVYFLVLCPMAFLRKLSGLKTPLRLSNPESSNYIERQKSFTKEDFEKQW